MKTTDRRKPGTKVAPVPVPVPEPATTVLTEEQKKARTEAVAAEVKASLEKHGCKLVISRWIDDDGRVQAGMTISVIE